MTPTQIETGELGRELAEARFSQLYRDQGRAILAYALRRVEDPEDAADVVAETFLVVWRRLGEVPIGSGARPWLYAVARGVIANLHRTERRKTRLGQRLAQSLRTELATHRAPSGETAEVLRAMSALNEDDRELLLLVSWEGLTPSEAARVIGSSSLATRSRLHRARRRLRALLEERQAASSQGGSNPEFDMEEAR
ncbi:MAG TPA: sigma-70 family RNA polymerase sigma factor [Solirubrobacterales bacterium]|nr:sigma-70 family RNA polymerase sigma factor [Solirubrobacterales bacterium]